MSRCLLMLFGALLVGCSVGLTDGSSPPDAAKDVPGDGMSGGDVADDVEAGPTPDVADVLTDDAAVDAGIDAMNVDVGADAMASDGMPVDALPMDVTTADTPATDAADAGCPIGRTACGASCVDLVADPANCGRCANPCAAGMVCSRGACAPSCASSTVDCGGACVDLRTHASHCGVCGRACPTGQPCVAGVCVDSCAGNTCSGHGWCEGGVCLCDPGYAGATCSACDGVWQPVVGVAPVLCVPTHAADGTTADDTLDGTSDADLLRGLEGVDTVRGLDGNDFVNGNQGNDTVNGNAGRDEVQGGSDDDLVQGGSGDDLVVGGIGNDRLVGGGGNDRLVGGDGNDTLEGVDGDDHYMLDGLGDDVIDDLTGADAARCLPGVRVVSDTLTGGDRLLRFSTGRSVRIVGDRVERILGCL